MPNIYVCVDLSEQVQLLVLFKDTYHVKDSITNNGTRSACVSSLSQKNLIACGSQKRSDNSVIKLFNQLKKQTATIVDKQDMVEERRLPS